MSYNNLMPPTKRVTLTELKDDRLANKAIDTHYRSLAENQTAEWLNAIEEEVVDSDVLANEEPPLLRNALLNLIGFIREKTVRVKEEV